MSEGLQALHHYAAEATAFGKVGGLILNLHISDPELCAELEEYEEGRARHEFALSALKIGTLALRHANGRIDAERIRKEGDRLLEQLGSALTEHQRGLVQQLTLNLKEYFDPQSGRFNERIERLIRQDGDLENLLHRHIGADNSQLACTLTAHIGERSPLMQLLDPEASDGLLATLSAAIGSTLAEQRNRILEEFSLDNKAGALSRLVAELNEQHAQASGSLTERVQQVVSEFSLDREDSALSRLVRRVEQAQKQISSEFSLNEQNSALARMRRELLEVIASLQKANAEFQEQVLQKLTEASARKEESRRSTRHGDDFEDAVFENIEAASQAAGDIATRTGNAPGRIKNCKKGDVVVELGYEHAAAGARIVVEAKEQASFSLKDALREIEMARKNRDAAVGLVVLSARTTPAGIGSMTRHGNDVIVVWDPEDRRSDVAMAAGLSVAKAISTRAVVQRASAAADFVAIECAIRNIEKRAQDLDQISVWATTIKNNGEQIVTKVASLKNELTRHIETLDEKIRDVKATVSAACEPQPGHLPTFEGAHAKLV
jgi:gas vesicle protein